MTRLSALPSKSAAVAGACHTALALCAALALARCGESPPAKSPDSVAGGTADGGADAQSDGGGAGVCSGADLDLTNVLVQSACEVPNAPDDARKPDVSATLDVKLAASPAQVAPGGHADLIVTYTNKSQAPLSLDFLLDPTPRFSVEVYTAKGVRAEMPHGKPPHAKGEAPPPNPTAPGTARVTIAPGGRASAKVDWSAVKLRWEPKLVKGTPPEQGYPTAPAGPLPKGTYTVKVLTPLIGVFEGSEREVSTVKTMVTVQ